MIAEHEQLEGVADVLSRRRPSGEHKVVTILFADLQNSSATAAANDAEDWFEALERFQSAAVDAVDAFGGVIASYGGDGVMAIFGAPIAHERHAEQACRAAVQLVSAMRGLAWELTATLGTELAVRVGVNSGRTIVGRVGREPRIDYTAQGVPVVVAARLEQIAGPNEVLLSAATVGLLSADFTVEPVGDRMLKGVPHAVSVSRLRGWSASASLAEPADAFVGRATELALLEDLRAEAVDGPAGLVIVGPAGVGKSALLSAFAASERAHRRVAGVAGDSVGIQLPLSVLSALLDAIAALFPSDQGLVDGGSVDGGSVDGGSVDGGLACLDIDAATLATAEQVRGSPHTALADLSPEAARLAVNAMLADVVRAACRRTGLTILIDDLHAIDRVSRAALFGLLDSGPIAGLLLIATMRPGLDGLPAGLRCLDLDPLSELETALLIESLAASVPAADRDVLSRIVYERSAGNPLFVVETIRSLTGEADNPEHFGRRFAGRIDQLAVPERVETAIAARIDRLPGPVRDVLFAAAVVGLEVDVGVLRSVAARTDAEFDSALNELVTASLLRRLRPGRLAFAHRVVQEVTYGSQLRDAKRTVHRAVAEALVSQPTGRGEAAEIARHYDAAALAPDAARWYMRAAARAALTDPADAARLLQRIRTITSGTAAELGEPGLRARIELLKQGARSGLVPDDVLAVLAEIRALADGPQHRLALAVGLLRGWYALSSAGLCGQARLVSREAVGVADSTGIDAVAVGARLAELSNSNASGSVTSALALCDETEELLRRSGTGAADNALRFQLDFARGSLLVRAGRSAEGVELLIRAAAAAERADDRTWRVIAPSGLSVGLIAVGDIAGARRAASDATACAQRFGGASERVSALFAIGRVAVAEGETTGAIASLREAIDLARRAPALTSEEAILAELADAIRLDGDAATARTVAEEAIGIASERGNDNFELMATLAWLRADLDVDGDRPTQLSMLAAATDIIERNEMGLYLPALMSLDRRLAEAR